MSDDHHHGGWWLLECGHYGHDEDQGATPYVLLCQTCREVEKFNGHVYRGQPARRRVRPA